MKFVVTAGPTREAIDPVRYLSNRSSGKMGYALAAAALAQGHRVTLISGPVCLTPPEGATLVHALTADAMFDAVHAATRACDVLVMCAAIADFKAAQIASSKIKKQNAPASLALAPTRDILSSLPRARNYFVAGFAAETNDLAQNAQEKLARKHCDMLIANDVSDDAIGFESDENAVTIFFRDGKTREIARLSKKNLACELVKIISETAKKF
ncbi:MAG: hypothetical protein M3R59_03890 [Verrucomicrobiota bacterium]|nr:hypothetical protein [Verrucomicrobiota bacterium]